uniref:Aminotransferase-like plant mobile domain-containing protein n=1 Tax=Solanum lycopersicum TaxID=4081 RepID=A0A3Q7HPY2_SOLLC
MTGYSAYQLNPVLLEPSVLTQQLTHRSRDIWDGSVKMILNMRRCDGKFWYLVKKYVTHPRILQMIELSGLYSVYRSNRPSIDRSLITSLVERWRPETHTFHFRMGEATITLQDVEVLYGLPVNGDPILDFKRSNLKVTALSAHMLEQLQLPDLETQDMINQMARCYMFWMIAGMVIAQRDTKNNFLACLPRGPCATRWFPHFSWTETAKHVLEVFRDALDSMTEDQFIWEPYLDDLIESLPDYCQIGRDIWLGQTKYKLEVGACSLVASLEPTT